MENKKSRIPKLGRWLIALFVAEDKQDLIIGDFEEYLEGAQLERKSILWSFWVQFFSSFPAFVQQAVRTRLMLFQHAIRITLRTMRMHHSHFLLNVTGLSLGIACFTIIMLYVEQEKSYDKFHAKSQRIYRINDVRKSDGIGEESSSAPIPLANAMLLDYEGQIESAVRFFNFQAPSLSVAYEPNGVRKQFNESRVFFVDSTLFEIFDFELIMGNKKTVLDGPNKVLITQDMAEKYFENVDPIGQTLVLEGKQDLMVSGVLRNSPANSHIQFDFLISFATLNNPRMLSDRLRTNWIWNPCWTYVLLDQSVQPETLEAQFPDFVEKYFPESRKNRVKLYLQPLEDIHLHSHLDYEMRANGDIIYVYIFTSVAIFILIISYINFINLTTARSLTRHKEIGLRKVLGGSKVQLIWQFLSESIVTNLIAFVISIVLVFALVEMLGSMGLVSLSFGLFTLPWGFGEVLMVFLLLSLSAGLYPAYFLSTFKPTHAIKGSVPGESNGMLAVRKLLVVSQFTLSIILIIATLVAFQQFEYLKNRSLGFDSDRVVLVPSLRSPIMNHYEAFRHEVLANGSVSAMTTVEDIPGIKHQTGSYEVRPDEPRIQFPRLLVHNDYTQTLGIPMAAGRDFSKAFSNDHSESVVINKTLAKQLGYTPEQAVGKKLDFKTIIGVTEDYHFTSLHQPIGPFVLEKVKDEPDNLAFSARYIAVRVEGEQLQETLKSMEEHWYSFVPNTPFEFHLLQDKLDAQYDSSNLLSTLVSIFSILSIFIACLGLYGLAAFVALRRTREVGIRKILGANFGNLLTLFSSPFLIMVLIAFFIAAPLVWWALSLWLNNFAYSIQLGVLPFLTAGCLGVVIVLLTVGYHSLRLYVINPVDSMRVE